MGFLKREGSYKFKLYCCILASFLKFSLEGPFYLSLHSPTPPSCVHLWACRCCSVQKGQMYHLNFFLDNFLFAAAFHIDAFHINSYCTKCESETIHKIAFRSQCCGIWNFLIHFFFAMALWRFFIRLNLLN